MRRVWVVFLLGLLAFSACGRPAGVLHLSTTTSVENSGLLAAILPAFQHASGIEVRAVAVGSGRALEILKRGDSDAALTHDPAAEQALLDAGLLADYRKVMFNDFVIAGPPADPSQIRPAASAGEAMTRIARGAVPFASRADSSGTHTRELSLWKMAGVRPPGASLIETGQGMAATLRIASERQAYVLTDRSTFRQIENTLQLQILFEGDPPLLNTYAVTFTRALEGDRLARVRQFVDWLTDGDGRASITSFTIKGQQAFTIWPAESPRNSPSDLPHAR